MLKKQVGLIFLMYVLFSSFAGDKKNKFVIQISFEQAPPSKLYLYSFYGVITTKLDSARADKAGRFRFYQANLKTGFYRISVNDTNYVDVILSPKDQVEMVASGKSLKKDTFIKKSIENKPLWDLKASRSIYHANRKEILKHVGAGNVSASRKSLDSLENSYNSFAYSLLEKNKNTYFFSTNKIIVSPAFTDSLLLNKKYKRDTTSFLKENFFNNIDFSNPDIVNSTLLPIEYMKYFERCVNYNEEGFKYAVDLILLKSKVNQTVYQFSLNFLLRLFDEAGPELIFEYIVENYADNLTCENTYFNKAQVIKTLKKGGQVPQVDISTFTKYKSLPEIYTKNKLTLIYFWSSHCNFCTESFPLLAELYAAYHSKGFDIIGFSLDKDEQSWSIFSMKNQLNWFNFNDFKGWESPVVRSFAVNKTPTYYLIDSYGHILEKSHNFDVFTRIIEKQLR